MLTLEDYRFKLLGSEIQSEEMPLLRQRIPWLYAQLGVPET